MKIDGWNFYTTSIIAKLKNPCYSDDNDLRKSGQYVRKGKDMIAVMNAYYQQRKPERQALDSRWEQSLVLVCSCKIRKRRIIV